MDLNASGYENIFNRGIMLGLDRQSIEHMLDEIIEFTELGPYLGMPLRTYSSGMRMRLGFVVCTSVQAEILLLDEWLSVADKSFRVKAEERMLEFVEDSGILLIATHNLALAKRICNKAIILESGRIQYFGLIDDAEGHWPGQA